MHTTTRTDPSTTTPQACVESAGSAETLPGSPTVDEVRALAVQVRDLQARVTASVDRVAADPARRAALLLDDLGDLLDGL